MRTTLDPPPPWCKDNHDILVREPIVQITFARENQHTRPRRSSKVCGWIIDIDYDEAIIEDDPRVTYDSGLWTQTITKTTTSDTTHTGFTKLVKITCLFIRSQGLSSGDLQIAVVGFFLKNNIMQLSDCPFICKTSMRSFTDDVIVSEKDVAITWTGLEPIKVTGFDMVPTWSASNYLSFAVAIENVALSKIPYDRTDYTLTYELQTSGS